jgi:ABC-2 type transport system permease protein
MTVLCDMLRVEFRKAVRSGMPLWTLLGSMLMPLGIAFLIFVSRNPDVSKQLGLVSAKADLLAYAATDWHGYLAFTGQMVAAGGFFLYVLILSWVFGREFVDGTLKDILAVPVPRLSIVLAKFIVAAGWSAGVTAGMVALALLMGAVMRLPGGSTPMALHGGLLLAVTAWLTMTAILPFALLASLGRGYLLPLGAAVLTLILTNLVALLGWGEYFPFAAAGLYAQGTSLPAVSYLIVLLTGLAGILATHLWWTYADQPR